jgi:hypothetical protein
MSKQRESVSEQARINSLLERFLGTEAGSRTFTPAHSVLVVQNWTLRSFQLIVRISLDLIISFFIPIA